MLRLKLPVKIVGICSVSSKFMSRYMTKYKLCVHSCVCVVVCVRVMSNMCDVEVCLETC